MLASHAVDGAGMDGLLGDGTPDVLMLGSFPFSGGSDGGVGLTLAQLDAMNPSIMRS